MTTTSSSSTQRFLSLEELRLEHTTLLKRQRERVGLPGNIEDVRVFVSRAKATGAILETTADRSVAQTLIDYWSTILFRASTDVDDSSLVDFDPSLEPVLEDSQCPYENRGNFPASATNHFYGRQRLFKQCLNQLQSHSVCAIVGPSGSGRGALLRD